MDQKAERPSTADKVKLERKYIRLQEVGVSCWISIAPAVWLLDHFHLAVHISVAMTILFLAMGGYICLELGEEKRNALWANRDNIEQGGD
ncbi:MAG: hypothetical protein KAT35_00185 [Candidatus Aenigmarchaeota archaeon]|nr:hypothetical protein [Candidatus Aenigmarchaeota archaeon]